MTILAMRPWLDEEETAEVAAAIASDWLAQGPRVAEFEGALAESLRVPKTVDPWLTGRARVVALIDASRQPVIDRFSRMLLDPAATAEVLKLAAMGGGSR